MNVAGIVAKVLLGIVFLGIVLDKTLFPIVKVMGDSMSPTYKDGEYFIAKKVFNPKKLKKGDVVILQNPTAVGHNILVKRIDGFNKDKTEVFVLGDNSYNSYDSREFGFFPIDRIMYIAIKSRRKR